MNELINFNTICSE